MTSKACLPSSATNVSRSIPKKSSQPHENPTIGILLCADKNDAVVKFSLPENQQQIIASQYRLYLPSEEILLAEMHKEIAAFEQRETLS